MNRITIFTSKAFALAIAMETAIWLIFLRRLRVRHPRQWLHAAQPALWQDRTALSARVTMRYLHDRDYLSSADQEGMHYCGRGRTVMLATYWFTAFTGVGTLIALALDGW
jgi:hypothetical protein